ncbi:DUF7619 domain-containing protein [Flavobacterium sp. GCM10023249]|uniref:DUF7619 domain-containing protein n=1 Tax=unclassified Flavobacterium TaxID=196869 RepID=UPI00360E346F
MMKKLFFLLVLLCGNAMYSQLNYYLNIQDASCFGADGSLTVTAFGGSAPYTIALTPPAGVTQQVDASTFRFVALPPGTYGFLITDSNGQTAFGSASVSQPAVLVATAIVDGNTITVITTGGVPGYSYTLSMNGGPIIGSQTANVFTGLQSGYYQLIVTDSMGCSYHLIVQITSLDINALGEYVDLNGDGYTSIGDVIDYQISVKNNRSSDLTNVMVTSSNATVLGGPIATLTPGTTDSTTFTARHVITQEDINRRNTTATFNVTATYNGAPDSKQTQVYTNLNISSGLKLNAFVDANSNGTQEVGENNIDAGTFNYQVNGGAMTSVSSVTGKHTVYESNPSSVYNVSYTIRPELAARYSIATATYNNITVPANSGITTLNFALTELPYLDANVTLRAYGTPPRPGFTYKNQIVYTNNGNAVIPNGTLTFTHDSLVSITSVSQTGTLPTANGFTYSFTNLLPYETRMITVEMQVPVIPIVSLGQVVTNTVALTDVVGDSEIRNDTSFMGQVIVGSYDPNDKSEAHGGKIVHSTFTENDYLNYTIRFENTGTYEAVNVRVNDVLDNQLDEATLETISASHPYILERKNNVLNWKFDGIQLPPSVANSDIGHGFIHFRVKPKPGYAIGDSIPNTASIYFDFNPAIVTNTCTTEFVKTLEGNSTNTGEFLLFPNPVNGIVSVVVKNSDAKIDTLTIMDLSGKTVLKKVVNDRIAVQDVTNLASGMYFIQLRAGQLENTIKIVKQ